MNWNDLRYFIELSRQKRLLHAARRLGVDHTTVARRIEQLEKDLGCKLVEQGADGYRLTDAGTRLLEHVLAIENRVEKIGEEVASESHRVAGTVRVGVPEGFGTQFLAPRLDPLLREHPELQIEMLSLPRFPSLATREADIIVTLGEPESGRCVTTRLVDFVYGLYASPDYLARHAPLETLSQLELHPLIGYVSDHLPSPFLQFVEEILPAGRGLRFSSTGMLAQLAACQAGMGVGILAHYLTVNTPLVEVLGGQMRWRRTLWMMALTDCHQLRRVRIVWDYVQQLVHNETGYFVEPDGKAR